MWYLIYLLIIFFLGNEAVFYIENDKQQLFRELLYSMWVFSLLIFEFIQKLSILHAHNVYILEHVCHFKLLHNNR